MYQSSLRAALTLALPLATACSSELLPIGEVVVVVDTDLSVPSDVARLRVDLYAEDGTWYESRDVALRNPSDWPASFGLTAPDGVERRVLVRLRGYPEGSIRDYRGERFIARAPYQPTPVASTIEELCAAPVQLPIGGRVTVRQGRAPFIGQLGQGDCGQFPTAVGSAAAVFDIETSGTYRFGVLGATPQGYHVTLQLRSVCEDELTAFACDTGLVKSGAGYSVEPAELEVQLDPGRYHVVTTGSGEFQAPTDIVLGAAESTVWPPPEPAEPPPLPIVPRLLDSDALTPRTEPQPLATVDRLLLLRLVPDAVFSTRVILRGACLGTMAMLDDEWPHQSPSLDEASTCVATEAAREPLREAPLDSRQDLGTSLQGTFPAPEPCGPATSGTERVCVPGGQFLLGTRKSLAGQNTTSLPEHAVVVGRFWVDRHEVTVARYRAALALGFQPGLEAATGNEGPLGTTVHGPPDLDLCTWSAEPRGREDFPLNCVTWYGARALCNFVGGDLPTEAQWEYVATAAGRTYETSWPWGDDAPVCDCDGSTDPCHKPVFGRSSYGAQGARLCYAKDPTAFGPLPVTASEGPNGDETPPLDGLNGVVGLAGGVEEWVLDAYRSFDHPCWDAASLVDPVCFEEEAPLRVARGGMWLENPPNTWSGARFAKIAWFPAITRGFRCAYSSAGTP